MKKCIECGSQQQPRRFDFEVEIDGVHVVVEATNKVPTCVECGAARLSMDEVQRLEQRAAAGVLRVVPEPTGAMLRYARKALGLKQVELGGELGVAGETVSRWETNALPIPRAVPLALIALLNNAITPPTKIDGSGVLRLPSHAA